MFIDLERQTEHRLDVENERGKIVVVVLGSLAEATQALFVCDH